MASIASSVNFWIACPPLKLNNFAK